MSQLRLLPYRTIGEDDVSWDSWWLERDGIRQPLPALLPGWDYASREFLGTTVEIDGQAVLASTGLRDLNVLELVLSIDCPALGRRFLSVESLEDAATQRLELVVEVPPGEVAQKLDLAAHLVLREDIRSPERVASRRGSRLGSSARRSVILEGESSRFPTDAVAFEEIGLERAPWTLTSSIVDLHDSFMGSIRLLINESHPLGQRALSPDEDPLITDQLKVDVFRMLVAAAAEHALTSQEMYDEDSVGAVVTNMCELYLRMSLLEVATMYRDEPLRFERLCYQAVSE